MRSDPEEMLAVMTDVPGITGIEVRANREDLDPLVETELQTGVIVSRNERSGLLV